MKLEIEMQEVMDYLYDILNQDNNIEADGESTFIIDDNTGKMYKANELTVQIKTTKKDGEDV